MNTYSIDVRDKCEWAEFFVNEREPQPRSDGGQRYSVTWVAYSSFGTFGHHWYDMGSPFAEFIRDVSDDYLLSKIGKRVVDGDMAAKEIKRLVIQHRKDGVITKDEAREALDDIATLGGEYTDEILCHRLYESVPLSKCEIEWCDVSTMTWDVQSRMFVKKLWPKFVAALNPVLETAR